MKKNLLPEKLSIRSIAMIWAEETNIPQSTLERLMLECARDVHGRDFYGHAHLRIISKKSDLQLDQPSLSDKEAMAMATVRFMEEALQEAIDRSVQPHLHTLDPSSELTAETLVSLTAFRLWCKASRRQVPDCLAETKDWFGIACDFIRKNLETGKTKQQLCDELSAETGKTYNTKSGPFFDAWEASATSEMKRPGRPKKHKSLK